MTPAAQEGPVLDAVLEVADSGMTYRRRYMSSLRPEAVLDLLVADETNPRSLASQLVALAGDVDHSSRRAGRGGLRSSGSRWPPRLGSHGRAESLSVVEEGNRPELVEFLDHVAGWLPILSDAITQQYLSHLQTSRHLATPEKARQTGAESGRL